MHSKGETYATIRKVLGTHSIESFLMYQGCSKKKVGVFGACGARENSQEGTTLGGNQSFSVTIRNLSSVIQLKLFHF